MTTPSVILNGKSYPLSWGNLAKVRYTGVPANVRAMGGAVDIAVMVWACIAEKPNPFETWEHVAEVIEPEQIPALVEALAPLFEDTAEKKSTTGSGPLLDSASA
jgi:hypothetical protein